MHSKWNLLMMAALGWSTLAGAADLTIHLSGSQPISRKTVQYQCDGQAAATGLPATAFPVEYINGAGNSLVIVPVHGASLIFTNVTSGFWCTLCRGTIYLVGCGWICQFLLGFACRQDAVRVPSGRRQVT